MKSVNAVTIKELYDLSHTEAKPLMEQYTYPWEVLPHIGEFIVKLGESLPKAGPAIIGAETEVRQCAFVRGNALVGKGCVIGNSTELKNVIIFDNVQVPHYNYVGDSILGFKSHMGAGSITSNVKSDKTLVHVKGIDPETNEKFDLETGLKKFGAMLGNHVEVGCNSVLNPGTVIGSNSNVYPLSPVRGFVPAESIYKTGGVIVKKHA